MSRRVSKRLASSQGVSKTKRRVTDDELHIDQAQKKSRHENDIKSSSNDGTQLNRSATTTDESLCSLDFESDLAKAIKLSLTTAEESCEITKLETGTTSNQHHASQKHCPLCDVRLKVSDTAFERHVNECLDQSSKSLSIPDATTAATVQPKISSWGHIFHSIPSALQNSWLGKMVSTEDKHSMIISSTSKSTSMSTTITEAATTIATTSTISTSSSPAPTHGMNLYYGYLGRSKPLPLYKWMKDTRFIVDAFNYGKIPGCDGYFLTHFHSDHYGGLNEEWSAGPIYCSQITANLVMKELDVDQKYVCVLPMNEPTYVAPHIKVTLIDANHCPGSVLFIFDIQRIPEGDNKPTWVRHLHTGDFRANPQMCLHPMLRQPDNPTIDNLYLDTTYLNAKYGFPAQEECIQAACRVIETYMGLKDENRPKTMLEQWIGKGTTTTATKNDTPKSAFDTLMSNAKIQKRTQGLLVVVGTYLIGKEKVFCAIARLLKSKIYTSDRKRFIYRCQENPELDNMLTNNPLEAQVHVLPLNDIKADKMLAYLKSLSPRFTNIIAFRPTGWSYRPSKAQETDMSIGSLSQVTMAPTDRTVHVKPSHSSQTLKIYGLPYSEHSSFRELASFIASLDINHVVPTVYYETEKGRQKMLSYLEKWQQDKQGKPIEVVPYPAESHW